MSEQVQIVHACLVAAAFWAFWQYGWKVYALDSLRQSLFSMRADLFQLASSGQGLSFNSNSYVHLRNQLNKRIRFAHKISFAKIVLAWIACAIPGLGLYDEIKSFKSSADIAIENEAQPEVKKRLAEINRRSTVALGGYLFMTSPVWLVISILMILAILITCLCQKKFWLLIRERVRTERALALGKTSRVVDLQAETCDEAELGPELCPA